MVWKVGEAKQRLSEVLRRAAREPQVIQNRDTVVAAVLGPEDAREFLAWRETHARESLSSAWGELAALCAEEDFTLEVPPRVNRANPFDRPAHAHRHQRPQ